MIVPQPAQGGPLSMHVAVAVFVLLAAAVVAFLLLARWMLRRSSGAPREDWSPRPRTEDAAAFAAASMQGVIQKLREQEKELERLHRLERERAEETERLTEEVTRNMPAGLLLVNAAGIVRSANPAAEAALGSRGLQYRSYTEILGADSPLAAMLRACLRDGRTFQRDEIEHATPAGEIRRLGVTISPVLRGPAEARAGRETKISGSLCLMSDLTELAALQKQIRWKENLATLGEMAAGIAHEFKNSLATISGYAQMIRAELPPGEVAGSAQKILDQTRALTHVVTEFLRFARPLEVVFETVELAPLVARVIDEIREFRPQVEIRAAGEFVSVPGDAGLLRQALLNLARNAAEAIAALGPSGRATIHGAVEEKAGRKWQRITVSDNGPGIPSADLGKVFLPFFTTKTDGTGLGLAVVQKIALQHGGSVEARNGSAGGAEFLLWLPLRQGLPAQAIAVREAGV